MRQESVQSVGNIVDEIGSVRHMQTSSSSERLMRLHSYSRTLFLRI